MRIPDIVSLVPVEVQKPWGQEVWFTGIEARGESRVELDDGERPLSEVLTALGRSEPITLLKRLEPTAGDLYLEVHAHKHEIYCVEDAGELLVGTRAEIGALKTVAARAERDGNTGPVEALIERLRVAPGDTIDIPPGLVHSLRRGVGVIEFQTPVYERKILAAFQPIATQAGWDVDAAARLIDPSLEPGVTRYTTAPCQTLATTSRFRLERRGLAAGEALPLQPFSVVWCRRGRIESSRGTILDRPASLATAGATIVARTPSELIVATEI